MLERMAKIARMERGKSCRMGARPHCNHQTWQDGRNAVRYVAVAQAASVQEAIDGYGLFMRSAEQYADEIIRRTRPERVRAFPKPRNNRTKAKQE